MAATIDVLIRPARVVDGTGNLWRFGDVALTGGRIAAIASPGALDPAGAAEIVEAAGMAVCPGIVGLA